MTSESIRAAMIGSPPDSKRAKIITLRLSDVQPKAVAWLWSPRIALGKVTLIVGDPGLGKSMLTCAMAAHVSRGTPWPVDHSECPRGDTIMVSAEDDPGDTIRPRLDATGADVSKVHVLTMVTETDSAGIPVSALSISPRISLNSTTYYARRLIASC